MKERSVNADVVRVVAMMMVIFLHTILNFTIRTDFFNTKLWWLLEPVVVLSKTCVLLFFMLSGYLVISKQRTIKDNLNKILSKILMPLSFFTLVNIAYLWTKFPYTGGNGWDFVLGQIKRMASFPSSPMWFLVVLAGLYFLNPVWQIIFDKKAGPNLAKYITWSALAYSLVLTFVEFPAHKVGAMLTSPTAWTAFAFFYFYGGLVKNNWVKSSNQRFNLGLILVMVILIIGGDSMTMYQKVHGISFIWNDYTGNYLSVPVTLLSIGLFNLLMSADLNFLRSKLLLWLSSVSFGVYLIHTYVISLFTDQIGLDFNKLGINVYLYNFLNVFLVTGISVILTVIWLRIPKLKRLIGG